MSGSPIGVPPFRAALQGELGDRSGTAKKVQVSLLSLMLLSGGCQLIDIIPKIRVSVDETDLAPGDQISVFMERGIRDHDVVILACTPQYKEKFDNRARESSGVGAEAGMITTELNNDSNAARKFIPVLRAGERDSAIPYPLLGRLYLDLREFPHKKDGYDQLVEAIKRNENKADRTQKPSREMMPGEGPSIEDSSLSKVPSKDPVISQEWRMFLLEMLFDLDTGNGRVAARLIKEQPDVAAGERILSIFNQSAPQSHEYAPRCAYASLLLKHGNPEKAWKELEEADANSAFNDTMSKLNRDFALHRGDEERFDAAWREFCPEFANGAL